MPISDPNLTEGLLQCGLLPALFTGSGSKALRGPCTKCGGNRRMVVFLNGQFPKWFMRCDLCGFEGWAPHLYPGVKWPDGPIGELPTPEQKDYTRALTALERSNIDEVLHDNLTPIMREQWRKMGIPDSMQDFYKLGHVQGRPFKKAADDGYLVLDAYSIPKYAPKWHIRNVDFRLIDPPEAEGKYRPFPGAPPTPFLSRPDLDGPINQDGIAFIVEGAKKAMVTSIFLDQIQIIGVPSANSWAGVPDMVRGASLAYVILDPNAWIWSKRLSKAIGPAARQVTLPTKIDDAIIAGAIGRSTFEQALKFARREGR